MTVGKLYGGILIHENWRNTKFGSIEELRRQEAELEELERAEALAAAEDAAKEVADRGKQKKLIQCNTIVVDFSMHEGILTSVVLIPQKNNYVAICLLFV